ncbi:hypothetical protein GLYMA_16G164032v4 [Glycine max]|nr:hypothetical protein GLYMA_16G164032v4 [Glycine max]KAH1151714.1 hypothetical protein GYH30_045285 [Glycine max]
MNHGSPSLSNFINLVLCGIVLDLLEGEPVNPHYFSMLNQKIMDR